MKNAIKYGLLIGILSGIWLLIMHVSGVYTDADPGSDRTSPLEYASVIIPFIGLFLGIKNYRDGQSGGKMEFMEGLFEGFKILLVAGVIVAFFAVIYVQFVSTMMKTDYMGRVAGAGIVGILFTLVISLLLMNKQRNL